ncbi:hypothetical protein [Serratia ureilytica]|uniref:hypothetical protein n=1 Tax=Serratia ureilytica TaxID=300181 RepID=UPI00114F05B0|nr:hypothetical protein [Serratia ureilytica]MBJ2097448.1 hypothetical protein [Serratia ureilytica]QDI35958.1 hypothetical protein FG171_00415 [Serratia marcescens]
MIKVIVFFNSAPSCITELQDGVKTISRSYPNGERVQLPIMTAGLASRTGDHTIVHVASDRDLTSDEIFAAAEKLL